MTNESRSRTTYAYRVIAPWGKTLHEGTVDSVSEHGARSMVGKLHHIAIGDILVVTPADSASWLIKTADPIKPEFDEVEPAPVADEAAVPTIYCVAWVVPPEEIGDYANTPKIDLGDGRIAVPCEFDGGVCYESYRTLEGAKASADDSNRRYRTSDYVATILPEGVPFCCPEDEEKSEAEKALVAAEKAVNGRDSIMKHIGNVSVCWDDMFEYYITEVGAGPRAICRDEAIIALEALAAEIADRGQDMTHSQPIEPAPITYDDVERDFPGAMAENVANLDDLPAGQPVELFPGCVAMSLGSPEDVPAMVGMIEAATGESLESVRAKVRAYDDGLNTREVSPTGDDYNAVVAMIGATQYGTGEHIEAPATLQNPMYVLVNPEEFAEIAAVPALQDLAKRLLANEANVSGFADVIESARASYATDNCEIDDRPVVTEADEGAWVQAWLWVDLPDDLPSRFPIGQAVRAIEAPGLLANHEDKQHDFPAGSEGMVVFVDDNAVHASFSFPDKTDGVGIAVYDRDQIDMGELVALN